MEECAIKGYNRFENPYCRSEYMSGQYEIYCGDEKLVIDFMNPVSVAVD